MNIKNITIKETAALIKDKKISPVELTKAFLERIETVDKDLNTYITVLSDQALKTAESAENEIMKGNYLGPLHGVPIGLKDIFVMKDVAATCGSKMLENFISPYDATVTTRIKKSGAVILGKNNMDEFAMGSSNETSFFGPVRNPWNTGKVPGGSSGGSASATAAGLCTASLGTDTGGSIRQPAALCGVTGLKPTYGRVSRYGMIAFASSLDQAGPLTRSVEDAAIILNTISGRDKLDSTSVDVPVPDFTKNLNGDIKGMKIGIPKEYFVDGMDNDVEKAVLKAIQDIKSLGAEIVEISLPHTKYAISTYYIIAPCEASSNLARYDGVRYGYRTPDADSLRDLFFRSRSEGFGEEVKRRIMLGTYALSSGYYDAYYLKSQKVRTLIREDFKKAWETVDVIVAPTTPETAFNINEKTDDPIKMYLSDVLTIPCNIAGIPGLSTPCGFSSDNLPIGLQILGKSFDEDSILRVAHAYEKVNNWNLKTPDL
ncbi:MAG: Asp-tRNA(Asn)/Glu-tRNA(Gln) amidotransferase subunit GatA [Thermodesulfobacteriota bacterium]